MYKDELRDGLSAAATERFVIEHGNTVLRVARSYCNSSQDAEDVYQRTVEILMIKAPNGIEGQALVSWACTVARNEALMISRGRRAAIATDFDAIVDAFESELPSPEELLEDEELLGQGREVLSQLRPDQARCLLLRADDLSYPEICEATGFSYAKVNRLLSEGRQAMRARHELLVSGSDCRRLEPALSLFADDAADEALANEVKMHLEHCMGCRATLRDYRDAPGRVAGVLPIGILVTTAAGQRNIFARAFDQLQSFYSSVQERLFGHVASGQQTAEAATAKKIIAAAAIGGTLIAGGAAVEQGQLRHERPTAPSAAAHGSSGKLVDSVHLSAAERSRARASVATRRRTKSATDSDLLARGANGRSAVDAPAPVDHAVAQDQAGYAADPADQPPAGAENTKAPVNDGVGP